MGSTPMEKPSTRFRALLDRPGIFVGVCAYDCISARLLEEAGFEAVFHGGLNTAGPLLGLPDVGLITMTDMVRYAENMANAVSVPVLCDVDDGFGDIINVIQTTREVIRAGLAGLYMEDQRSPKKCPALGGGGVIDEEFMVRKLEAVCAVREELDPDLYVIARTHSSRVIGMDEAMKRGIAYAKAGADAIFVDPSYSDVAIDEFKRMVDEIGPHAHVLASMTETVGRPLLTTEELEKMGVKIAYYPVSAIITAAGAVQRLFKELKEKGTTRDLVDGMMPLEELSQLMGIDAIRDQEKKFS